MTSILEGMDIHQGPPGGLRLDGELLGTHVLFLGGIGSGKTNAMKHLLRQLRGKQGRDYVFVIFDTKGDFLRNFQQAGDVVISSDQTDAGAVLWNLFRELSDDPATIGEEIYEIASTIFSDELGQAGQNIFFAAAARDIFAATVEALSRLEPQSSITLSNELLKKTLTSSSDDLYDLISMHDDFAGTARFLEAGGPVESIMAFLQLTLRKSFSGVFGQSGDFSIR